MSRGISLSGDEGTFLAEAVSISIEAYNATKDTSRVTLLTNSVFKALEWPWNNTTAHSITDELELKGLIVFVRRTSAAGRFYVTDKGVEVAGYNRRS
jgi:hypothetical protein